MKFRILSFTVLVTIALFGLFTYIPNSNDASLTNNPFGELKTYDVSSNWSERGELTTLLTNGDIIYPDQNQQGTWESEILEENSSAVLDMSLSGDPRDGTVNVTVRAWEDLPNGGLPDKRYFILLNDFENSTTFNNSDEYNYFQISAELTETSGSANQRPNLDSISLSWITTSSQIGLNRENFQILTLMIFFSSILLTMVGYI